MDASPSRWSQMKRPSPLLLGIFTSFAYLREYSGVDGASFVLFRVSAGGVRLADVIFACVCGAMGAFESHESVSRDRGLNYWTVRMIALSIVVAVAIGWSAGGRQLFFDWRPLVWLALGFRALRSARRRGTTEVEFMRTFFLLTATFGAIRLVGVVSGSAAQFAAVGGASSIYDGPSLTVYSLAFLASVSMRMSSTSRMNVAQVAMVISGAVVLLSYRRTAWVIVAVGLLYLAAHTRRKASVAASIIVICLMLWTLPGTASTSRITGRLGSINIFSETDDYASTNADHVGDLRDAMDQIRQHPILGYGLGRPYETRTIRGWKTESWLVHNGALHALLFYGALGLTTYLLALYAGFRQVSKAFRARRPGILSAAGGFAAWFLGTLVPSLAFAPWLNLSCQSMVALAMVLGFATQRSSPESRHKPALPSSAAPASTPSSRLSMPIRRT